MTLEAFWAPLLKPLEDVFELTVVCDGADQVLVERLNLRTAFHSTSCSFQREPQTELNQVNSSKYSRADSWRTSPSLW